MKISKTILEARRILESVGYKTYDCHTEEGLFDLTHFSREEIIYIPTQYENLNSRRLAKKSIELYLQNLG